MNNLTVELINDKLEIKTELFKIVLPLKEILIPYSDIIKYLREDAIDLCNDKKGHTYVMHRKNTFTSPYVYMRITDENIEILLQDDGGYGYVNTFKFPKDKYKNQFIAAFSSKLFQYL